MDNSPITKVADAIARLDELEKDPFCRDEGCSHKFPFGVWFRGQPATRLPLEPRIFRNRLLASDENTGGWDETNVYEHLRLRAPAHDQTHRTPFDWLCLMQHYSVPTRLLDWSESILSALHFAAKERPDEDGEVIVLNARRLNRLIKPHPAISPPDDYRVVVRAEMAVTRSSNTLRMHPRVIEATRVAPHEERPPNDEEAETGAVAAWLEKFRQPVAVFPRWLSSRMSLQSSVVTLHGGKTYVKPMRDEYEDELMPGEIPLEDIDRKEGGRLLKRFTIPNYDKPTIMRDLFRLGVHEGTLFPEIDRQAIYMRQCWWYRDGQPWEPFHL